MRAATISTTTLLLVALARPNTAKAGTSIDAFATYSPVASYTTFGSDGHGPEGKGASQYGIGADAHWPLAKRFALGFGARYDFRPGGQRFGALPFTARLLFPQSKGEWQVRAALGPALSDSRDGPAAFGGSSELGLPYQRAWSSTTSMHLQAGTRLDVLLYNEVESSYLENAQLINGQLFFLRLGLTFSDL
jgi:hypothetical protein